MYKQPYFQALFADSIPTGKRSLYYMWRDSATFLARGLGPLIAVIIFLELGKSGFERKGPPLTVTLRLDDEWHNAKPSCRRSLGCL